MRKADFLVNLYIQHIRIIISDTCVDPEQRIEALMQSSERPSFYGQGIPTHIPFIASGTLFDIYSNGTFCCAKKSSEYEYNRPAIAASFLIGKALKHYGIIVFVTDNPHNTYRFDDDALLLGLEESRIKRFLFEK